MASIELLRSGSLLLSNPLPKVVNRSVNSLRRLLSRCRSSSPVGKSMRSLELLRSEPLLLSFTLPESSTRPPGFSHLCVILLTALPSPPPEPPDPPDSRSCSQILFCPPSCTSDSGVHPLLSTFPPLSPSLATAVSPDPNHSPEVVNFASILSISPCKRPTEVNEVLLALWFSPPLHSLHRLVPPFVRMLELLIASAPAIYQKIKLLFWLPSASFYGRMMMLCADESFVGIFPKASLSVILDQSYKSLSLPVWACFGCWLMCVGFVPLPPMVFCGSKEKSDYIPFGLIKTLQLNSHERERCRSTIMGSPRDFSVTSLKLMSYLLKKLCYMVSSPYSVSMRGSSLSESFPECLYNFLTDMSASVVSMPLEGATGLVSTLSGGRSCFIKSPCNVTIDYSLAVKAFSTHLNSGSSSLSVFSQEDEFALCLLLSLCFIVLLQRGCFIPSPTCNRIV